MAERSFARFWLGASVFAASMGFAAVAVADHVAVADTTSFQSRPIPLGVSGSSQTLLKIRNLLYCYTGTLGSLVEADGIKYILSNNHVLAKENENLDYGDPSADDTIIQQGNLDEGSCSVNSGNGAHAVAQLSGYVAIQFSKGKDKPLNTVDAAIASVESTCSTSTGDCVDPSGAILGIGTVSGVTGPSVDMPVQKTGRTTAHTFGKIEAIDVTLDVSYESGTARFGGQMRIRRPCDDAGFSAAGDSGSLIVTVPDTGDPQVVGLLFAGSDTDTFANPIQLVLNSVSV